MEKSLINNKAILRKEFLGLLRNQKEKDRLTKSRAVQKKLFASPEFRSAQTVMFYASFDGEVNTFEMMARAVQLKKRIVLPIVMRDQKKLIPTVIEDLTALNKGPYGILQPPARVETTLSANQPTGQAGGRTSLRVELSGLDLALVPGLAFDKKNNRLGRGAGYYDRFLHDLPSGIPAFGLAFDFQVVDCLPLQPHDIPVKRVIIN